METNGKPPDPETLGGQGAKLNVMADDHHRRADARMAAKIISLGVVSVEVAEYCLRGAFTLAVNALKEGDCRNYVAAMQVPLAAARVESDRINPPQKSAVNVNVVSEIVVKGVGDFYSRNLSAGADGAPAADSLIAGEVQGSGLRAAVGKNGGGTDSGS